VRLVGISLRKGNFWQCQNVKLVLLPGVCPTGPPTGLCPCTPLGTSAVPRPLPVGGPGPPAPIAVYFLHISAYFKSYNIDSPDWPKNILIEIYWTQNFYSIINWNAKESSAPSCPFYNYQRLSVTTVCVSCSLNFFTKLSQSLNFSARLRSVKVLICFCKWRLNIIESQCLMHAFESLIEASVSQFKKSKCLEIVKEMLFSPSHKLRLN